MTEVVDALEIAAATGPIDATIRLPGSKSYTNRAMVVAALAQGETWIEHGLDSDDTRYMAECLRALGIYVHRDAQSAAYIVIGEAGRIPVDHADLYVGNGGTVARFLTAMVALGYGEFRIDGVERMRERPIGPLLDALRQLNVPASGELRPDYPPVIVRSSGLLGGSVDIDGAISSQFVSALMMVAPCTPDGIELKVRGDLVSKPYVELTASVMASFGASVVNDDYQRILVPGKQPYVGHQYVVEPDASGASYFFAAAAITGGRVRVEGLGRRSAQGDLGLVGILERMGCKVTWADDAIELVGPAELRGVDVDMGGMSDVAQTLAAIAPFATGDVRIRGVSHIRHKETDRVHAVTSELQRLGARIEEFADGWSIHPSRLHPARIETYDDHRMAMSFAITGLRTPGIVIENPRCVSKTFPDFFARLEQLANPSGR